MRAIFTLLLAVNFCWAGPETSAVKVGKVQYIEDEKGITRQHGGLGSGVVVASNDDYSIILTNAHVAPVNAIYHVIYGKRLIPCDWIAAVDDKERHDKGDLALLKCWAKFPTVQLADKEPEKNAEIQQWGYPGGGRLVKLGGKFLGHDGAWSNTGDYLTPPGCSGSGVYYKDKLIGLCYMISNMTDSSGNAIYDVNGTPIPVPPCYFVTLKQINSFLAVQVPTEMGYEKGPLPHPVVAPSGPRR
jgi:hypothetical protein